MTPVEGNSPEASSQCKKATQNTTQQTSSYKLDKCQNVTNGWDRTTTQSCSSIHPLSLLSSLRQTYLQLMRPFVHHQHLTSSYCQHCCLHYQMRKQNQTCWIQLGSSSCHQQTELVKQSYQHQRLFHQMPVDSVRKPLKWTVSTVRLYSYLSGLNTRSIIFGHFMLSGRRHLVRLRNTLRVIFRVSLAKWRYSERMRLYVEKKKREGAGKFRAVYIV